MQLQGQIEDKESLHLPAPEVFFIAARRSLHHEELDDIIRLFQKESGLPGKLREASKKKVKKESVQVSSKLKDKHSGVSFDYEFHDPSHEYVKNFSFFVNQFYSRVNIYELHYGRELPTLLASEGEDYIEKAAPIRHKEQAEEETPEMMNQIIQHIIHARLFGALGDITYDDKEKFTNWRKFNKHLRRFYEGGFYASSITKSV